MKTKLNKDLWHSLCRTFPQQEGSEQLLLLAQHHNGYKRQKAVIELGLRGNPMALPILIHRINDWVPQVRQAAAESLVQLLSSKNTQAFVLCLPDLYHLKNCARGDHELLISRVIDFLVQVDNADCVRSAINNEDPLTARIAMQLCFAYQLLDKQQLVAMALSHNDIVIRKKVVNYLSDFSAEVLDSFLKKAIQDPYMPIRREALQIILRERPEQSLLIAEKCLFDRHYAIRTIAIKHLLKNAFNVQQHLIQVLLLSKQSALKLRCAILGLAELDAKRSIALIEKHSSHLLPSIRKAVLQALSKLTGEQSLAYLITGLQDASPAVAKEASRLINKFNIHLPIELLIELIKENRYSHTLMICLTSAKKINKWNRLLLLLKILNLNHMSSSKTLYINIIDYELIKWHSTFNRSSSQPSKMQIEHILIEFKQAKALLNKEEKLFLEFTIKGF